MWNGRLVPVNVVKTRFSGQARVVEGVVAGSGGGGVGRRARTAGGVGNVSGVEVWWGQAQPPGRHVWY